MSVTIKPTRYAHPEGHTGVCYYDGDKGGLVTCGADGDVRYWLDLMDDDPMGTCIAEHSTAIVSKNGKLYVGNDNNTVQILTLPDLEKEGVIARFSAAVSALASAKNSKFVVSGGCDMRIQVTNVETSDSIELNGHEAPILGLSLDPKEEYVASSSCDGSIRIWRIHEKKSVHTWENVVPKCNSFFTAKNYCTPSFSGKNGDSLAYPHGKEIIVVERDSWKEKRRFECSQLRTEISICKFSECGSRIAASSVHGEIVIWDVESGRVIGYVEHNQNPKITSLAWHLEKPNELAFCDSLGQLGCVDIVASNKSSERLVCDSTKNGLNVDDEFEIGGDNHVGDDQSDKSIIGADDDDDDDVNIISLNKIKKSVRGGDDDMESRTDVGSTRGDSKIVVPEINVQQPFQPGSTPVHLLSRFMMWNDTGIVKCYASQKDDDEDASIEVEFHDTSIHHTMHITNYLGHTLAALSPQALALSCPTNDGSPSKLVVVALQGWGSANKEWSADLPEGEESVCLAAGQTFVAVATSRRNLRIFTVGGTQREVIALPGAPVAMNGFGKHLVVACHAGVGLSNDQHINLMWIMLKGPDLTSRTLSVPLSPSSELLWLGLSDLASPTIMDEEGLVKMYDKKSCLWRVVCDTVAQCKNKLDCSFIIGVSERERTIRRVLCKSSRYPPTTPRPMINEIPMIIPLCDPDSEKSAKEALLWQIGSHPHEENEAVLSLFGLACRANVEFRAVELCEQIASEKVIELAIKYAARSNRIALANKLESIIEKKDQKDENVVPEPDEVDFPSHNDEPVVIDTQVDETLLPITNKKPEIEIRPLRITSQRINPFLRSSPAPVTKGLASMNCLEEKVQKPKTATTLTSSKPSQPKNNTKKETFVAWLARNRKDLQEEFPDLSPVELSKAGLKRYKEESEENRIDTADGKKRRLSSPDSQESETKRSAPNKSMDFLYNK